MAKCLERGKSYSYSWRSLERPDLLWEPQSSVQWAPGCSFPGAKLTTPFHIVRNVRKNGAIPSVTRTASKRGE